MRLINNIWSIGALVILVTGCGQKDHNGTFVAKWKNEYSIADDTIIIKDDVVTKRTGYHKIRNGVVKPKEWSVRRWVYNDPMSPIIEPGDDYIIIGSTTYERIK